MRHQTNYDRRTVIAAGAASAATALVPGLGRAAPTGQSRKDARLHAMLMRHFDDDLMRSPTGATSLGLDTGRRAALRSRFPDWSAAGRAAARRATDRQLAELRAFGRAGLGADAQIAYDSAIFSLESDQRIDRFAYHSGGFAHRAGPYAVTQLGGFYTGIASFLDQQHPVKTRADADAYLARLAAVPVLLDSDTALVAANAAMGVIAPRFVLDQALLQLGRLRNSDPATTTMVASLRRRSEALGIRGYGERAQALFAGPVRAALDRQIAALTAVLPRATQDAGVARLPDGAAYYAAALRLHTTTELGAAEIHKLGLDRVAELTAQIDALLKAQGFRDGSVIDRMNALGRAPGQQFANTDAGRGELIAYLNGLLKKIEPRLPRMFARLPTLPYEIRRVPPEIEVGAPGGSAQRGLADGSRPGIFFINLRDTAEWPRYTLPTLAWHEGAPGHLFEGALSLQNGELPIYRQTASATAYSEGWGLYAEQVADELGMYDDDPLGKIGYLASYAFRASRLVVDTGIHAMGWSRERAIRYLADNSSKSESAARTEIDRYIVYPGQACAYMIGQIAMSRLRGEVETRPGYDIKRFHSLVLDTGRVPLAVLERQIRAAFA